MKRFNSKRVIERDHFSDRIREMVKREMLTDMVNFMMNDNTIGFVEAHKQNVIQFEMFAAYLSELDLSRLKLYVRELQGKVDRQHLNEIIKLLEE